MIEAGATESWRKTVRLVRAQSHSHYAAAVREMYRPVKIRAMSGADDSTSTIASGYVSALQLCEMCVSASYESAWVGTESDSPQLVLVLTLKGGFDVTQCGRYASCTPMSLILLNGSRALDALQYPHTHILAVGLPTGYMKAFHRRIETACVHLVSAKQGVAAVLRDTMMSIWREQDDLQKRNSDYLAAVLARYIGAVFSEPGDDERCAESRIAQLTSEIDRCLSDPTLDPAKLAARVGVSTSHLYMIVRRRGTTIGKQIMQRRLEQCRLSLVDPAEKDRPITDIALGWGFKELSHFSRCFAAAYGTAPKVYRSRALAQLSISSLN
jgi:AraC-like DNA-binding protein